MLHTRGRPRQAPLPSHGLGDESGRRIQVTTAQLAFGWQHLLGKLAKRSRSVGRAQHEQQPSSPWTVSA
jgi:hypothetical protein